MKKLTTFVELEFAIFSNLGVVFNGSGAIMFLRYRQSKIEARAAIGHILRVDFTAMSFYDRAHNRQSHSQPLLLGGEKLVEQLFVHLTPNACAMIAHAQAHFAVAITSCANLYLALARWCLPHR